MPVKEGVPRVAASSYLNTAPLIWSFLQGSMRDEAQLLTHTAPARCADLLAHGMVEAALVPVIEYQRIEDAWLVPDVCVGSRSRVRSVVLVTRRESLKDVRRVALDIESRTSVALVRIIYREFLGFEPEWTSSAPDLDRMLGESDAALLIGDPAMVFPRERLRVYDLAALWREHTGLGFVFAMWMIRAGAGAAVRRLDFARARDEGLAHVEEIAAGYQTALGLPQSELVSYLIDCISFRLDAEMNAGLDLFFKLAHRHGITDGFRPLQMLGI